ncbi:MAG: phospho-N-acetylmuramoyl-pentapeptide-transferase [Ruminococcus sp.]|nr:phospho-N-acetylmuramoyl-pentapeptide-transferase [Ruminococcus sp.]
MPYWINLIVVVLAFCVSAVAGYFLLPFLRKLNFGQTIKEVGPTWHKSKQGTPIMGGFMFIIGSLVATAVGVSLIYLNINMNSVSADGGNYTPLWRLLAGIAATLLFCAIGFADDYIKAVKKQNLGLNSKQKLIFQFIVSALYLAALYLLGDTATTINFYFFTLDLGIFYYPIMILFITYIVNTVNLTDGIDGLCGSVTAVSMVCMTVISSFLASYDQSVFSIAVAGACVGFLIWNLHPAKVFMGDTGSMYLGGAVVTVGMALRLHIVLVIVALVYVLEGLSVVLQVTSYKLTKKRIFKMSPIHHHFEMSGWGEYKIVIVFSLVAAAAGIGAIAIVVNTVGVIGLS